jgi:pyrroloquinoline quinone biosynthesis protein D
MSGGFGADSIPRRVQGANGEPFGDDFIVLDSQGRTLRGLNATAARVWQLCDGKRSARALAEQVAHEFSADVGQVLPDTLRFLTELARLGLIEEEHLEVR